METTMRKWWIDDAQLMAGSNPSDGDLASLRGEGFSLVISLLDSEQQRTRYDKKSAAGAGWSLYRIPIAEGQTPTLVQVCEFTALTGALPKGTKSLVFCDHGLARSAFMGAVYWIGKGLSVPAATARIASRCGVDSPWTNGAWQEVLLRFEALGWRI